MSEKHGYRAELDLNNKEITVARKHCGAARYAYNYGRILSDLYVADGLK